MEVSKKLIDLRKDRKLTQEQVAEVLQIKRSTYASYETGRVGMDTELLQKLAKHYSVSVDSILNSSSNNEKVFKVRDTDEEFMGITKTEMAAMKAAIKVLTLKVVSLEQRVTKKPYEKISLALEKTMKEEYDLLLDELRKRS